MKAKITYITHKRHIKTKYNNNPRTIEINSLEDLKKLYEKENEELIITDITDKFIEIDVYDYYIE